MKGIYALLQNKSINYVKSFSGEMSMSRFFQLIKCIRCPSTILKRENVG